MKKDLINIAQKHGFTLLFERPEIKMLRFHSKDVHHIDVYCGTGTVRYTRRLKTGYGINTYKKNQTLEQIEEIFKEHHYAKRKNNK